MPEGKILIMGVGGCGSSFLWHLLDDCGYETKGINEFMRHGGVREAIRNGTLDTFEFPQVIKHLGGFLVNLNEHIDRHNWEVQHIFFCVSSLPYQLNQYKKRRGWDEKRCLEKYRKGLGEGMIQLIERDHDFTIIRSPRSVLDPRYCYEKVKVVLGDMSYAKFREIHQAGIIPKYLERAKKWA